MNYGLSDETSSLLVPNASVVRLRGSDTASGRNIITVGVKHFHFPGVLFQLYDLRAPRREHVRFTFEERLSTSTFVTV